MQRATASSDDNRTVVVVTRLSPGEFGAFREYQDLRGITLSSAARELILVGLRETLKQGVGNETHPDANG